MRLNKHQLRQIGLRALEQLTDEKEFGLFQYQDLIKPALNEVYDVDLNLDRFRNHSYRLLKLLESEGIVLRLSGACINDAQYRIIDDSGIKANELELVLPSPLHDEELYREQLKKSKYELTQLLTAHRELQDRFPVHGDYLARERTKLEKQVSAIEYKCIILDKIIHEITGGNHSG